MTPRADTSPPAAASARDLHDAGSTHGTTLGSAAAALDAASRGGPR